MQEVLGRASLTTLSIDGQLVQEAVKRGLLENTSWGFSVIAIL